MHTHSTKTIPIRTEAQAQRILTWCIITVVVFNHRRILPPVFIQGLLGGKIFLYRRRQCNHSSRIQFSPWSGSGEHSTEQCGLPSDADRMGSHVPSYQSSSCGIAIFSFLSIYQLINAIQMCIRNTFDVIVIKPSIDFSKGGVHETDGFWWVIFQRGEYTKPMGFWWVIFQRGEYTKPVGSDGFWNLFLSDFSKGGLQRPDGVWWVSEFFLWLSKNWNARGVYFDKYGINIEHSSSCKKWHYV